MRINYTNLQEDEKSVLWEACGNGDKKARDRLIELNLPLVGAIAGRFSHSSDDYGEMFQCGVLGLIKAIEGFDPQRRVTFGTYAFPFIQGEMLRQIAFMKGRKDKGGELRKNVQALNAEYVQSKGCGVTVSEAAADLGVSMEEIILAQEENQVNESDVEIPAEDSSYDSVENRIFLEELLQELPYRERNILQERYFQSKTQEEIAEELGLSQTRVSRIEKAALLKLKGRAICEE
ncbi:MAG: sigma-70 family RNA polymerase sigma factor [Bacillota bacterium]|nr:sigma-70 family RNA polymerase sigma factor [Bacillota bacterium]